MNETPFYATFGINTLPFGVFTGSGPWDTPLTAAYFNPQQAPQMSVGYYNDNFNASTAAFSDEVNHDNNFVFNLTYNKSIEKFSYGLGAGYITDLKSNSTGSPASLSARRTTNGMDFGSVWDFNGNVSYSQVELTGEYLVGNETVGGNTGKPAAYSVVANYTPQIAGQDTTFGVSHSQSYNLKDTPVSLSGLDAIPLTISGLKNAWAIGVSRTIFTKYISLGCNFEKGVTYSHLQTFTTTLDLVAYL